MSLLLLGDTVTSTKAMVDKAERTKTIQFCPTMSKQLYL